jgi:DNA (cytosine-5)-methyltransferase 1
MIQGAAASPLKFIDLFCGIGSFHESLAKLGAQCVFASDINENARKTYEANHGLAPAGDICAVNPASVPAFDVLCAGFPCQPFSVAGYRKGFDDKRGDMFFQTMRFVEHHRPIAVILENVLGLLKHDDGKTFKTIIDTLEAQGYVVRSTVLTCSDYGIPQMRKRLFIVAMRVPFPETLLNFDDAKQPSVLSDFLNHGRPAEAHVTFTQKTVAYTIRCGGRNSAVDDGHNWDGYRAIKPDGTEYVYRLTLADCLKLQGFDETTFKLIGSDSAQWKMLGNTIPTNFTRIVGTAVCTFLRNHLDAAAEPATKQLKINP